MSTAVAANGNAGALMESVLLKGDLSKLTPQERVGYYNEVCRSVGLNPLTQPLQYITLNGKLTLYARRDCADQLRKIHGISIEIVSREVLDGMLTIHVRAKDKTGRTDEDFGVVSVGTLKGELAANAFLKAVTKAKRRVTLSISGLGFLDETEVEDIPRENPHINRAQEIQEPADYDEQGQPVDNIPFGDPGIRRLTAHQSKIDADKANNEMLGCQTAKELRDWMTLQTTSNRVDSWPVDWSEIFRGRVKERLAILDAADKEGS